MYFQVKNNLNRNRYYVLEHLLTFNRFIFLQLIKFMIWNINRIELKYNTCHHNTLPCMEWMNESCSWSINMWRVIGFNNDIRYGSWLYRNGIVCFEDTILYCRALLNTWLLIEKLKKVILKNVHIQNLQCL